MKKVAQLLYPGIGGLGSVVFNLVEQNKIKKKWKDFLVFTGPNFSKRNKDLLKNYKTEYYFNKTKKFLTFLTWPKIFIALLKFKPDILIIHNFDIIPSIIYKIIFKKKIIYVDHTPHFGKIGIKLLIVYFFVKYFSDKIVVLNKDKFKFFLKKKILKKKLYIIPNGIKNIKVKKIKKFSEKKLVIGMASRMNYKKCHELIIDTFNSKKIRDKNFFCYFAGDGENIQYLKNKVKKLSLENKIFFLGNLKEKDLHSFYKKLDLYIQASKGEVLSISILEAFNYQIPAMGSNVEGIKNFLIPKKKIGIKFENNKKSLLKKIIYFHKLNKKMKSEYSKNQKKYFIEKFTSEKMYKNYQELLNNV